MNSPDYRLKFPGKPTLNLRKKHAPTVPYYPYLHDHFHQQGLPSTRRFHPTIRPLSPGYLSWVLVFYRGHHCLYPLRGGSGNGPEFKPERLQQLRGSTRIVAQRFMMLIVMVFSYGIVRHLVNNTHKKNYHEQQIRKLARKALRITL